MGEQSGESIKEEVTSEGIGIRSHVNTHNLSSLVDIKQIER